MLVVHDFRVCFNERLCIERSLAVERLENDHTQRPPVDFIRVEKTGISASFHRLQYLRADVVWSPHRDRAEAVALDVGYFNAAPEIGETDMAVRVEEYVVWLHVPVDVAHFVEGGKG